MALFLISVVIAAKDPAASMLELCLASFSSLENAHRIQVVIALSGALPKLHQNTVSRFGELKVINVPPNGVYSAYNEGIGVAEGTYVLFFGVDDIALPGMDTVIDQLGKLDEPCHLFAAACYMQAAGVSVPSRYRTSLVFRNWCHQGIFYLRSYLLGHSFQVEYKAQADHKMNIDIVSNKMLRFIISKELVAYFSAGGVSSLRPDITFRNDFSLIVARAYGSHYGFLVKIKQLVLDVIFGDPSSRFKAKMRR